jgi:hypothetical protein
VLNSLEKKEDNVAKKEEILAQNEIYKKYTESMRRVKSSKDVENLNFDFDDENQ